MKTRTLTLDWPACLHCLLGPDEPKTIRFLSLYGLLLFCGSLRDLKSVLTGVCFWSLHCIPGRPFSLETHVFQVLETFCNYFIDDFSCHVFSLLSLLMLGLLDWFSYFLISSLIFSLSFCCTVWGMSALSSHTSFEFFTTTVIFLTYKRSDVCSLNFK